MGALKGILKQKVLLILIGMFIAASVFVPYFLSTINIVNLITQVSLYGIMALGMTFAILAREFDLSIGAVMAFSGVLVVRLTSFTNIWIAILIILLVGALTGLITGLLVGALRLNSFVITLCAMFFYNGLALALSGGKALMAQDPVLNWLGNESTLSIPNLIWIFVVLFIVVDYTLRKTKFGRNVYAVGGDDHVASLTGIRVKFYKIIIFVLTGVSAAIAGILLTGEQNSASPIAGGNAALSVISSVVIGGTSLAGGEGSVVRTVMGLFIFGILDNSLSLLNVPPFDQSFIKGVLLVTVIGWDYYARKSRLAHSN